MKLTFFVMSSLFVPIVAASFVTGAFGDASFSLSFVAFFLVLVTVDVYWVRYETLANAFFSIYGYDGIALLKKVVIVAIVLHM